MTRKIPAAALALLLSLPLCADEIHLKNGGRLAGKVKDLGDRVEVRTGKGMVVTIPKEEIEKIVHRDEPEEEPEKNGEEAPSKDAPGKEEPPPGNPMERLREVATVQVAAAPVLAVRMSPDGDHVLATCDREYLVSLQKRDSTALVGTQSFFHPGGRHFCVANSDRTMRLCALDRHWAEGPVYEGFAARSYRMSPDGSWILGLGSRRGLATITAWKFAAPGEPGLDFAQKAGVNISRFWFRKGRLVVLATSGELQEWSLRSGKREKAEPLIEEPGDGTSIYVTHSVVSGDGRAAVLVTSIHGIWLVDVAKAESKKLEIRGENIESWRLSPDGAFLLQKAGAAAGRSTVLLSLPGAAEKWRRAMEGHGAGGYADHVFSPDGASILGYELSTIDLVRTADGSLVRRYPIGRKGRVSAIAFTPDGGGVLAGDDRGAIHCFAPEPLQEEKEGR